MSNNADTRWTFWVTPAIGLLAGLVFLLSAWAGGHPGVGAVMLAVMAVFAAALVLAGRRSETVRGLLDHRDERLAGIDVRATAAAGTALILAVVVGAVVELARGHSGAPFTWLAAVAGLAYVAAVVTFRVKG